MPDTVALFSDWLRERAADTAPPIQGWDSVATVVEGRWLDRVPDYPDAAAQLTNETRLMPRLAPLLPLEVPVPIVLDEKPLRVRHQLVDGEPATRAHPHRRRRTTDRRVPQGAARHAGQHLRRVRDPRPGRGALRAARHPRPDAPPSAAADPGGAARAGPEPAAAGRAEHADHPHPRRPRRPPPAGPRRPRSSASSTGPTPGSPTPRSTSGGRCSRRRSRSPPRSRRRTAWPTTSSPAPSTGTASPRGTTCCGARRPAGRRSSSPGSPRIAARLTT